MSPEAYAPLIALPLLVLRNRRPRTLNLQWMWVMPVLIVPLMALAVWGMSMDPSRDHRPFDAVSWVILAVGAALGCVAGWWRGRMTTIEKHPDGTLKAQASPIGLLLIVALLFGRRALDAWLEPHAIGWGLNALAIADAFLLFVAGMVVAQRIEMFIRARGILAGKPGGHVEAKA